jgi:hypothetical protein
MAVTTPTSSSDSTASVNGITIAGVVGKILTVNNSLTLSGADGATVLNTLSQSGIPLIVPPSGFMTATGGLVIGQPPSSSATVSFSATSGAGVTMTFSAATLLGTAADVGRVLTILDTTYKYAVITAQSSTTVATVTLTGTLSGTGPFANNTIWLTGGTSVNAGTSNTTAFSVPLIVTYANCFMYFPATSPIGVAGMYFCQMVSSTVGTVFNNLLAANTQPQIPGSPTAFSGLTPAAYTQSVAGSLPLASVNVPANSMGVNGMLIADIDAAYPNDAGTKTVYVKLGGSTSVTAAYTTTVAARWQVRAANKGVANSQSVNPVVGVFGTNGNTPPVRWTQDSTTILSFQLLGGVGTATDFLVVESYSMQLWPQA